MKERKEIERLAKFIVVFNDERFMNKNYRRGLMDALSFVLYKGEFLEKMLIPLEVYKEMTEKNDGNKLRREQKAELGFGFVV